MLEVVHGPMGSGKSLEALVRAHNLDSYKMPVLVLNYEADTRFGSKVIASRMGLSRPCLTYNEQTSIPDLIAQHQDCQNTKPLTILIEEAQFLTRTQVRDLHRASTAYTVVCYGIRTAANGRPFDGMSWLLSYADSIREVAQSVLCSCENREPATMHLYYEKGVVIEDPPTVQIGDGEYRAVCCKCFYKFHP